ncbi:MAG: nitroreductase [Bacillota bacterium]
MDIIEAIKERKSIRNFKPDPVPREMLEEILSIATRAPSGNNTQPWELTIVTGDVLDQICKENLKLISANVPPDSSSGKPFEGVYRQRQIDVAIQLFQLMGITREDKEKRAQWMLRGYRYFDAPVGIIVCMDQAMEGTFAMFDLGIISQTICLAALNYGLGTIIHAQGARYYPQVIKKVLGLPDTKQVVMAISIGYPDWDFPANKIESQREPLANVTKWYGFPN